MEHTRAFDLLRLSVCLCACRIPFCLFLIYNKLVSSTNIRVIQIFYWHLHVFVAPCMPMPMAIYCHSFSADSSFQFQKLSRKYFILLCAGAGPPFFIDLCDLVLWCVYSEWIRETAYVRNILSTSVILSHLRHCEQSYTTESFLCHLPSVIWSDNWHFFFSIRQLAERQACRCIGHVPVFGSKHTKLLLILTNSSGLPKVVYVSNTNIRMWLCVNEKIMESSQWHWLSHSKDLVDSVDL